MKSLFSPLSENLNLYLNIFAQVLDTMKICTNGGTNLHHSGSADVY